MRVLLQCECSNVTEPYSLKLKSDYFKLCVCMCAYVYVCAHECSAHGGQMRVLGSLARVGAGT